MKILVVGAWLWPQYEAAFAEGLGELGVEVRAFSTASFIERGAGRVQRAVPYPGGALLRLNRAVVEAVAAECPDWVLFWRPTHILPRTIHSIKRLGSSTASYNNDDPFGPRVHGDAPWHHRWLWHWYIRSLSSFDRCFFYRAINCSEAAEAGAKHAAVLMPYFIPTRDRPVTLSRDEQKSYNTDVVFVGHYEADGRDQSLCALLDAGVDVKIWGGAYWSKALPALSRRLPGIAPAEGENYAKALVGAKVCLCFLSKLNRDGYTRRCFEIPACGRLLLAERTPELLRLFKEDEEACFFSSDEELVEKVRWLLKNPEQRERIAAAGLKRVWADGHDVVSRAREFLECLGGHE